MILIGNRYTVVAHTNLLTSACSLLVPADVMITLFEACYLGWGHVAVRLRRPPLRLLTCQG